VRGKFDLLYLQRTLEDNDLNTNTAATCASDRPLRTYRTLQI
jgi:hypothetical protein